MDDITEQSRIHVAARIRPCSSTSSAQQCVKIDSKKPVVWLQNEDNEQKEFEFDTVLSADAQQSEVFEKVAKRIVDGCLDGYSGTILAYGQTNSGKTYTMQGADLSSDEYPKYKGIMPRAVEHLFERLETMNGESRFHHQVQCSFVELYNEQCFDLLAPENQPRLRFANNLVHMDGVRVVECTEVADVLRLIELGTSNRRQAETVANRQSSRSHSILIIKVETEWYEQRGSSFDKTNEFLRNLSDDDEVLIRRSARLNLVDLAGAERLSYTKAERLQIKEAVYINKSLTTLGRVIRALSKNLSHIPYRDSILTQLLADSLGGNSKTTFIVTLHPDKKQFDTTALSLHFSQALRSIKNRIWVNQEAVPSNNNINKTASTVMTIDDHLSISRTIPDQTEQDSSVTAFEKIEQLVNKLSVIDQQEQACRNSFRQLSLYKDELTRQLNAFKSGGKDSIWIADLTPPKSRLGFGCPSLSFNLYDSTQPFSPISHVQSEQRRGTIFASNSSSRNRSTLAKNVLLDFQEDGAESSNKPCLAKSPIPSTSPSSTVQNSDDGDKENRRRTTPRVPTPHKITRTTVSIPFDLAGNFDETTNGSKNGSVQDDLLGEDGDNKQRDKERSATANESTMSISSSKLINCTDFNNNHILSFGDDNIADENQITLFDKPIPGTEYNDQRSVNVPGGDVTIFDTQDRVLYDSQVKNAGSNGKVKVTGNDDQVPVSDDDQPQVSGDDQLQVSDDDDQSSDTSDDDDQTPWTSTSGDQPQNSFDSQISVDQLQISISNNCVTFTLSQEPLIVNNFNSQVQDIVSSVQNLSVHSDSSNNLPPSISKRLPLSIIVDQPSTHLSSETIVLDSTAALDQVNRLSLSRDIDTKEVSEPENNVESTELDNDADLQPLSGKDDPKHLDNEDDSDELSTTSESDQDQINNEVQKDCQEAHKEDPIVGTPKRTPMRLRCKTKVNRLLAFHFGPQRRRTMTLFNREVLARAVRAHLDQLSSKNVSNKEKHGVWRRIAQLYSNKCKEELDAEHVRHAWENLKRRVKKMEESEEKKEKMNSVDRLILTIMNELKQHHVPPPAQKIGQKPAKTAGKHGQKLTSPAQKSTKPTQPTQKSTLTSLQTRTLLKQAEFVQKMLNLKLMPEVKGQRVTYRPMTEEEQKQPNIELPLDFRPPNAVVKRVGLKEK